MPTTATVAPGLRELASFLDTHPSVLESREFPRQTLAVTVIIKDAESVRQIAGHLHTTAVQNEHAGMKHTATTAAFGGVSVAFVSIAEAPRVLRRDPDATAVLAERDA